jgi:hypothetical protein
MNYFYYSRLKQGIATAEAHVRLFIICIYGNCEAFPHF